MKKLFFFSAAFLLMLSSCNQPIVFKQYVKMDNVSWNRLDILEFEVPVTEDDILDFELALRHHTYFPHDYFYVNITFYSPDGDIRSADYDFKLKDNDGNWLSKGMGELWDIEMTIRKEMHFYETGICKVRVENNYPKIETPGIVEVGLIAKKSKN